MTKTAPATLTAKQLADAAAQGVAIALNARNHEASATQHAVTPEAAKFTSFRLICGGPLEMFNVALKLNEHGVITPGLAVPVQVQVHEG